ncbi:MAG: transglutaminase domain-containing protein [Rhodocyclaceae bacterium]|nr:transglutaminase domain-containing protein [Rhodocyclaceae bacterium]
MKRRTFLLGGLLASGAAFAAPKKNGSGLKKSSRSGLRAPTTSRPAPIKVPAKLAPELALSGGVWRPYELTIDVSSNSHDGDATLWIPIPMDTPWQQVTSVKWSGGGNAGIRFDPASQLHAYVVDGGSSTPSVTLTLRVETRTRQFDITKRGTFFHESEEELDRNVRETSYQGTSAALRGLAEDITGRVIEPLPRARAIYDWVLDKALAGNCNAFAVAMPPRTVCPNPRGEDVAIAFVNLCRALNIPARAVWGQVIGESRLNAKLGATGNVTQDQRVRAEFHTPGYGWIPVDPGDVLRLQRLESLSATDSRLQNLRKKLFGYWEMNWVGYEYGPGFTLPGGPDTGLPGLATPLATVGSPRYGGVSDASVRYRIDTKPLS